MWKGVPFFSWAAKKIFGTRNQRQVNRYLDKAAMVNEGEEATRLLSVLFLSGAIGAPILGLIATRVRWRGSILIVASVGCAVFSSLLILAELPRGAVMSLLFGLGFFTAGFALDLAYVRDLVTERMQGFALGTANLILGIVAGPLMLMLIAESLERTGLEGTVTASSASVEQIRSSLVWFVGGLILTVPLGLLLVHRPHLELLVVAEAHLEGLPNRRAISLALLKNAPSSLLAMHAALKAPVKQHQNTS